MKKLFLAIALMVTASFPVFAAMEHEHSSFSVVPLRAEEIQSPKNESEAITAHSSSEPGRKMEEGGMEHEEMPKDKEHEGMHGMMMHDMKGWGILIGVAMIVMMAAHVIVLF